jgi:Ca2+-binding RTX toxin-like protein
MHSPIPRRRLAPAIALAALLLVPALARGSTVADVRVVTDEETLADQRQYTGTVRIKTDPNADCFGPGSGGSGETVSVPGPTGLGIVKDAAAFDRAVRPISVSDSFDFGLAVCGFGGYEADDKASWYLKHNHAASQVGGDQLRLENGDDVLWYFDPDFNDAPSAELVLRVPARAEPGTPFGVRVVEYADDGAKRPAEGAQVTGAEQPTNSEGRTTVTLDESKRASVQATRAGAIPSAAVPVCVDPERSECPGVRGADIGGSDRGDDIETTRGNDRIDSGGGRDEIDLRPGGADRANCGGGRDRVLLEGGDADDRISNNCERLVRG